MTQANIFYSGVVQGVGFRYTTNTIAQKFEVCGWVKNLPDGRVEILAQGKQEEIERFMQAIESQFGDYIKNKQVDFFDKESSFKSFQITF